MRHQARFWLRSLNLPQVPRRAAPERRLVVGHARWRPGRGAAEARRLHRALAGRRARDGQRDAGTEPGLRDGRARSTARGFWERLWPQTVRQTAPQIGSDHVGSDLARAPARRDRGGVRRAAISNPRNAARPPDVGRLVAETIVAESDEDLPLKFAGLVVAGVFVGFFAMYRTPPRAAAASLRFSWCLLVIGVLIGLDAAGHAECARSCPPNGMQ